MTDTEYQRVEVTAGIERRRRWSVEQKQRFVEKSLLSGVSVSSVVRRREKAVALLDDLKDWLDAQRRQLALKSGLAQAFRFAPSHWQALARYAGDGWLGITSIRAENTLRDVLMRIDELLPCNWQGGETLKAGAA